LIIFEELDYRFVYLYCVEIGNDDPAL